MEAGLCGPDKVVVVATIVRTDPRTEDSKQGVEVVPHCSKENVYKTNMSAIMRV